MSETVYVIGTSKKYHTKLDCCSGVADRDRQASEWDKETAEAFGKEICKYCNGTNEVATEQGGKWPLSEG